jgi:hypothetical protein
VIRGWAQAMNSWGKWLLGGELPTDKRSRAMLGGSVAVVALLVAGLLAVGGPTTTGSPVRPNAPFADSQQSAPNVTVPKTAALPFTGGSKATTVAATRTKRAHSKRKHHANRRGAKSGKKRRPGKHHHHSPAHPTT